MRILRNLLHRLHERFKVWRCQERFETSSRYIRDRIKETEWEDRGYIRHLMLLHAHVRRAKMNASTAMAVHKALIPQYPEELEALKIEHHLGEVPTDPSAYAEARERVLEIERQQAEEREATSAEGQAQDELRKAEIEKRSQENWRQMGGPP